MFRMLNPPLLQPGAAPAQAMPATFGLRGRQPDRFDLTGAETRITYETTAAAGSRLTYDGSYGSQTLGEAALTTEEHGFGRLIIAPLGSFPDRGDLSLTLLLPWFNPRTIGNTASDPVPIATLAILEWVASTIAGPQLEGAREEYEVVELEGTAQLVSTLPAGIATDQLVTARMGAHDLPPTVDTLALARVTLPPGATAAAVNGAHYFLVEAGALTVRKFIVPGGEIPGTSPTTAGDWTSIDFDDTYDEAAPPTITNEGTEPAAALVVSLAATGGAGIEAALTGWGNAEPLAVADAAGVGPPLPAAGEPVREGIGVALVRVTYEPGASVHLLDVLESTAFLLTVEAGELEFLVPNDALLTPAGGAPQRVRLDGRVSVAAGDQLLVPAGPPILSGFVPLPGPITSRNVAAGPSSVLIVTAGPY